MTVWIIVIHMLVFNDETVPVIGSDFAYRTERMCQQTALHIAESSDYKIECKRLKVVPR